MGQLKFEIKSPFIPLFSKGDSSFQDFKTLFGKGEGEIFGGTVKELCGEFLRQDIK